MTQSLLTRPDRLAALRRTALLDSPVEEGFGCVEVQVLPLMRF